MVDDFKGPDGVDYFDNSLNNGISAADSWLEILHEFHSQLPFISVYKRVPLSLACSSAF